MTIRRGRSGRSALVAMILAGVLVGCGQPLESDVGLVVTIDSPSIGRVDGFELRTDDGEIIAFDTRDMDFHPDFPAAHLAEHQRMAERVRVTYRRAGDRRVVVRLADET